MSEFKIGILLPRSSLYPSISSDLIKGLKAGFNELNVENIRLIFENIGFGAEEDVIYSSTEKLLLQEEVEMVIAYLDHNAATKLDGLFSANNKLLLVLDPGAHVPTDWTPSPYRYTISLQAALNCRITGYLAASNGGHRTIFATSFYEAGYQQCYTYQRGLEEGGGKTCEHFIVPFRLEQFSINPLKGSLQRVQPDAVLALFSPEAGKLFLEGYGQAELNKQSKLYASSFMLEEQWLSTVPFPFEGITGATSWSKTLDLQMNKVFVQKIKTTNNLNPTIFSMLGWEAAQFVSKVIGITNNNTVNVLTSTEKIEKITFDSPRGALKMDPETHYLFSPSYYVKVIKNENTNNSGLQIIEQISFSEEMQERYIKDCPTGVNSKWTNTYLCI